MAWDAEFDLVCVGSGAGGVAAAVVAASKGARVLVVEKDDKIGGVTALTGGQIWVAPNPFQTDAGISDSIVQGGCNYATFSNVIDADPLFGALGDYGGFTKTLPVAAASPAVDRGDDVGLSRVEKSAGVAGRCEVQRGEM